MDTQRFAMARLVVAVGSENPVKVNSVRNAFAANFPDASLEVVGYSVPSGVDDQPWGDVQTRQGALNRAENALGAHCLAHGGAPPDFAVGLEGGVVEEKLGELHRGTPGLSASYTTCFAFMAVMSSPASLDGVRWGIARTGSFALPPRITALMRGEGGKPPMECAPARPIGAPRLARAHQHARLTPARLGVCGRLGDADDAVFADTNSKQKGGTVAKVTKGMVDRTAYYEHALHLALVPFVHDESTPGLYRDT
jgi:non-canonical (house-cleaning) NTP pyrophosphatase